MTCNSPFVLRLMSSSVAIANRAGGIIRSIMKTGELGVVNKGSAGKFDPQTEADRTAQKCIMASLLRHFPNLTIVGEEEGVDATDVQSDLIETSLDPEVLQHSCPDNLKSVNVEDVIVWVDPVDGTKEFTEGLYEHVTVLIGVSLRGKPIAGVIHQPFFGNQEAGTSDIGRTMWAIAGLGSFGFTHVPPPAGRRIITTTRSHSNKSVLDAIEAMKPDAIIRAGGAGYKVILLLEGNADGYIFASPGCKRWDTCACEALLEGVSGKLTDVFGNQIQYELAGSYMNKTGVIASLKEHNLFLSLIPENVKSNLKT